MSAHPVCSAAGRAMAQLVPLAPRVEKVNGACLVHQGSRERREPGAVTVFELPRMPRSSVQKVQREKRGRQDRWAPLDTQAPPARRARKAK